MDRSGAVRRPWNMGCTPHGRMRLREEPMATKPQTLGWSMWIIVLVVVVLILVLGMLYLAY